jgi:hypothetical protein
LIGRKNTEVDRQQDKFREMGKRLIDWEEKYRSGQAAG